MVFYHKGLRVRKTPLPFVAYARKAAILRVQIWSAHESDVVGLTRKTICFSRSLLMHDLVVDLFITRYEFGYAV